MISLKQRWQQRQTNWGMIAGLTVTAAFWAALGWAIWRVTH